MRCKTLDDIVGETLRLIDDEKSLHPEPGAEFFFRFPYLAFGQVVPGTGRKHRHVCSPSSDIGAVVETWHLPRCIESRCLGWTCSNTPKEAKLHEGSASSVRCYEFQVSEAFTLNAIPNAVHVLLFFAHPRAGNLYVKPF